MLHAKPTKHALVFTAFDVCRIKCPGVGSEGRAQEFLLKVTVGFTPQSQGTLAAAVFAVAESFRQPIGLEGYHANLRYADR